MLTKEDLLAIGSLMDEKLEAGLKPIKADITEMKGEIKGLKERVPKLEMTTEHQIDRAIKLLGEGHERLKQMIEGRLVTKEQQENSEARIFALEEVSKRHTVQIEELQKKTG
ncbi:MAG: hypothetical protein HFF11_01295 [Angelakisella sp.]|jgi:DNA repair ATPase RecN|nr:hypothetical protein [Angelakisella sp.]